MNLDVRMAGLNKLEAAVKRAWEKEAELKTEIASINEAIAELQMEITQPSDAANG